MPARVRDPYWLLLAPLVAPRQRARLFMAASAGRESASRKRKRNAWVGKRKPIPTGTKPEAQELLHLYMITNDYGQGLLDPLGNPISNTIGNPIGNTIGDSIGIHKGMTRHTIGPKICLVQKVSGRVQEGPRSPPDPLNKYLFSYIFLIFSHICYCRLYCLLYCILYCLLYCLVATLQL